MVIAFLALLGICFGSFVNAYVWRLHEQERESAKAKPDKSELKKLSILNGRSMCPNCHHVLAASDLIPVISWLSLRGKCRYCKYKISAQYPVVEIIVALLFVASYVWWPYPLHGIQIGIFVCWLIVLIGLASLFVYDLKWLILPDKIVYCLYLPAVVIAVLDIVYAHDLAKALLNLFLALVLSAGLFYLLFQMSQGKWIGGGDVKLGVLLGLVAGTAPRSILLLFSASLIGCLICLPLLASKRLKRNSVIPFGPLLIIGLIIVQLFGHAILVWYQNNFLS